MPKGTGTAVFIISLCFLVYLSLAISFFIPILKECNNQYEFTAVAYNLKTIAPSSMPSLTYKPTIASTPSLVPGYLSQGIDIENASRRLFVIIYLCLLTPCILLTYFYTVKVHDDVLTGIIFIGFQQFASPFLLIITVIFFYRLLIFRMLNNEYVMSLIFNIFHSDFRIILHLVHDLNVKRVRLFNDGIYLSDQKCPTDTLPHVFQWFIGWIPHLTGSLLIIVIGSLWAVVSTLRYLIYLHYALQSKLFIIKEVAVHFVSNNEKVYSDIAFTFPKPDNWSWNQISARAKANLRHKRKRKFAVYLVSALLTPIIYLIYSLIFVDSLNYLT